MRVIGRIAGVFVLCPFFFCAANAQSPPRSGMYAENVSELASQGLQRSPQASVWQPTLDAARQLASRTNRLVLVYFYADWCQACRAMDQQLAAAPGALSALQQQYVPVKVNADFFPATAKQYGVTGLPTTVLITPQGQVIDGIRGRVDTPEYVARLNQIAADARRAAEARVVGGGPATVPTVPHAHGEAGRLRPEEATPQQLSARGPMSASVSAVAAEPSGQQHGRWPASPGVPAVDPFSRSPAEQARQAGVPQPWQPGWTGQSVSSPLEASRVPAMPPSAPQGAAWSTTPPATAQQTPPAAATADYRNRIGDSRGPAYQPGSGIAPSTAGNPGTIVGDNRGAVPGTTIGAGSVYGRWTNNWAGAPSSEGLSIQNSSFPGGNTTSGAPQAAGPPLAGPHGTVAGAGQPASQRQPASGVHSSDPNPGGSSPVSIPPGNPPLGLDGYCAVCLVEKQKWVLGNQLWGVIHRGRTYLFDSPEDRAKFFADPDRYAPVMSGQDVVHALESGKLVPGYRRHGVYFGDRVYLFADEASLQKFSQNPRYYAAQALAATRSATTADSLRR